MNRLVVAFFCFLFTRSAFAQERPYARAERVDAVVKAEIAKQGIVGMAVVVIDNGAIAWMKGYGYADRETKLAVDPAVTQYRWASISKPITAIASLQLAEKGLLDLDADVRTYVPEFPDKGVKITTRQLLCHQAGIVHYSNGKVIRTDAKYTTDHPFEDVVTSLDTFKESPLVNQPGEKFSYTTHGYILLSAVVQRAGKEKFAEQVKQRIGKPLGMADFRPDYQWEKIPNRAVGYTRQDGAIRRRVDSEVEDVSWKLGGGGFTSPVTDLARFGIGLIERKLVSEETERRMWTINKPADPKGAKPYGYGFFVIDSPEKGKWVGHDGSQMNAKTALLLDPKNKRGIAVMTSSEWTDAMKLAMNLMDEIR